jgi:uncharacterized protein YqjF (DUF2071 family)
MTDRLAMRQLPRFFPLIHQIWDKLLFVHWDIPVEIIRPLIPDPLSIDTFEGKAWITITTSTTRNLRPSFTPPISLLSDFQQLSVRTYVHLKGKPGIWFFSLDANNFLAVLGARKFYDLPCHDAIIDTHHTDRTATFEMERVAGDEKFSAEWRVGDTVPPVKPGSLEFFLFERYCVYTGHKGVLSSYYIYHESWRLQKIGRLYAFNSNMIGNAGLPEPKAEPLLHCAGPVHVRIWPLKKIRVT